MPAAPVTPHTLSRSGEGVRSPWCGHHDRVPDDPTDEVLDRLTAVLGALAYAMTRPRAHVRLAEIAGVPLDRPGVALLRALVEQGRPLRIREMAEHLEIRSPNVTRVVQDLELQGLVRPVPDVHDRRARVITPTTAGLDALRRIDDASRAWLAERLEGVDTATVDAAVEVLARLRAHHEDVPPSD